MPGISVKRRLKKHMKQIFTLLLLCLSTLAFGQDQEELSRLVKLGELYSSNVNARGKSFKKEIEKLRSPELDPIIDALIAVGKGDKKLLSKQFLSKPSEQELKYWYVLREIHYNNQKEDSLSRPNLEVARETLAKEIDSRWLLDNYYYRIQGGIGFLFNDKNLSRYDITLDEYGLADDTEKAILFFALSTALNQRFLVLRMVKNPDKLLEFAAKLPTFNGKAYYEYEAFDFEDFEWIGYEDTESYKEQHLGTFYSILNAHFGALSEKSRTEELRKLYFNSILFMPEYFAYSGSLEDDLRAIYKQSQGE